MVDMVSHIASLARKIKTCRNKKDRTSSKPNNSEKRQSTTDDLDHTCPTLLFLNDSMSLYRHDPVRRKRSESEKSAINAQKAATCSLPIPLARADSLDLSWYHSIRLDTRAQQSGVKRRAYKVKRKMRRAMPVKKVDLKEIAVAKMEREVLAEMEGWNSGDRDANDQEHQSVRQLSRDLDLGLHLSCASLVKRVSEDAAVGLE